MISFTQSQRLGFHLDWILGCGGFHVRSICATAGGNCRWLWCFQGHGDVGHGCAGGTSKISQGWNLQSDKILGELATHPDKNTQTNTNSSNKIWTMSKSCVENSFLTHLQWNLPIWHAFLNWKLCWNNLPAATVFLKRPTKTGNKHSTVERLWNSVGLHFFVAKRFTKEISNTQTTNGETQNSFNQ